MHRCCLKQVFLSPSTSHMRDQVILRGGGRPLHCSVFSSIRNTLDAGSILPLPPGVISKDVPRYCLMSSGGKNTPRGETLVKKKKLITLVPSRK